jgi:hypothetical protein
MSAACRRFHDYGKSTSLNMKTLTGRFVTLVALFASPHNPRPRGGKEHNA